mgnify:CR=1 FL=1
MATQTTAVQPPPRGRDAGNGAGWLDVGPFEYVGCLAHLEAAHGGIDIRLPVFVDKNTRVDTTHSFNRFIKNGIGTFGFISCSHANSAANRKIEIILAILENTIGGPHVITDTREPWDLSLSHYNTMVGPVGKIR